MDRGPGSPDTSGREGLERLWLTTRGEGVRVRLWLTTSPILSSEVVCGAVHTLALAFGSQGARALSWAVHLFALIGLTVSVMKAEERVSSMLALNTEMTAAGSSSRPVAWAAVGQGVSRSYPRGVADASLTWKDGSAPSGYLAICVVVKDNHLYMREWVEYHLWLGVGAIYLWWVHGGRRDVAATPTTRRRARDKRSEHSG